MSASTTPSPTASVSTPTTSHSSASRRPPRKSTLTQQQKNQKRQRATQEQLMTLEVEFNKNPTPTASVRERIAQDINMTERSVQIWFQNRRAKIKNIAKKSIESGEDCDGIPDSMRRYLALQAMESGKGIGRELLARNGSMSQYGSGSMFLNTDSSSSKVVIHHFSCRSLSVGSWRRVGQSAMDLVIFYSPDKCSITYYINNDSAGYKIEYPFSYIKNISLENGDPVSNAEGASQRPGGLVVELNRPPNFFMDSAGSGGFYQCGDFTEEQQASQVMVHHLGGHPKVLTGQLAKLVSLESFQKRHQPYDPNALVVSAPVSPVNHRPASQPNHLVHPHMGGGMYPPIATASSFNDTLHPPRGHKRQRSRSVPIAVDLSMLRHPMPSFLIQQHEQQQHHHQHHHQHGPFAPPPHHPDGIFAPAPQHHHPAGGPNLSIDTSAAYGMDFRPYPLSATTAPSPSEFGTPALFTGAPPPDSVSASSYAATPFSGMPFMSPMADPASALQPSVSPLSGHPHHHHHNQQQNQHQHPHHQHHQHPHHHYHADPVIANQSPPALPEHDHGASDDGGAGFALGDMYGKHPLALPFRSPLHTGAGDLDGAGEELDLRDLVSFGTIDPASLSPEKAM